MEGMLWQNGAGKGVIRSLAAAAFCLLGSSACSPYIYNQEIANFSSGVNSTVASYQTGRQSEANLVLQDQQADYVKAGTRLALQAGCLDSYALPPDLPECGVVQWNKDASVLSSTTQGYMKLQDQVARAAPVFNAMSGYAAALTAITNASDDTSLKQATQNLGAAIGKFSNAVTTVDPAAAQANAAVSSATNLISQGLSGYFDEQRYSALRATVPAMDGYVAVAGKTMMDALLSVRQVMLAHIANEMTTLIEPFQTGAAGKLKQAEYQAQLAALESKVAVFNQTRTSDPSAAVSAMIKAHNQLANALTNNAGQAPEVLTASLNFAAAAEQFNSTLTAVAGAPAAKAVPAGTGAKK